MPKYIITVKANRNICHSVFSLIVRRYKPYVKVAIFTNKPYPHAHIIVSVKTWINYKELHAYVKENLSGRVWNPKVYIHLSLIHI